MAVAVVLVDEVLGAVAGAVLDAVTSANTCAMREAGGWAAACDAGRSDAIAGAAIAGEADDPNSSSATTTPLMAETAITVAKIVIFANVPRQPVGRAGVSE